MRAQCAASRPDCLGSQVAGAADGVAQMETKLLPGLMHKFFSGQAYNQPVFKATTAT